MSETPDPGAEGRILVLGAGNLLLSDDGVGIHAIRRLAELADLPEEVQVLDGGTLGLDLLYYLEGVSRLLIVDAVKAGRPPGTLSRLAGEEVPAYFSTKISPHQIALPDLLLAARLRDLYPQEVVVLGLEPASLAVGLELSPDVAAGLDTLVEAVLDQLVRWGVDVRRRGDADA
ncbi:MAG: hydrogenase maturation protease [Chloroflexi bacterium]|nr:MAG: hydrogenase maturation protease [Chloroflexota bacterium]